MRRTPACRIAGLPVVACRAGPRRPTGTTSRVRWAIPAAAAAAIVWDEERWHTIEVRQIQSCREAGLLAQLVILVNAVAIHAVWRGDFAPAASLIAEAEAIAAATGTRFAPLAAIWLAGFRGAETEAVRLIEAVSTAARAAGQGGGVQWSQRAAAVLHNGLGRYETALAEARQAAEQAPELYISMFAVPELIEAASRTGHTQLAAATLARLAEATSIAQTDWAQGIHARCRALLSDGQHAEDCYREAVDRLSRTRLRPELARAHLLYGEWLRRQDRQAEAREQLRTAHDMFAAIGMQAFAERARRELLGTGETIRMPTASPHGELTPQEAQIARWPARACPTRRSPPSCSCPRARSSTTWGRSSPSSISAPAGSSGTLCAAAATTGRRHNRTPEGLARRVCHRPVDSPDEVAR